MDLLNYKNLFIKQKFEGFELLGYETRNKYAIMDEKQNKIGFAAEQQKGIFGFFMRQFLGHWRTFEVHFFDESKNMFMLAKHPFRFLFQRFEVYYKDQYIGSLQQRFSILNKKFDILDPQENLLFQMKSPIYRLWTFPFLKNEREVARIEKKWTGLMAEMFTDKDTFQINLDSTELSQNERLIMLASSIFIDLQYFERKSGR